MSIVRTHNSRNLDLLRAIAVVFVFIDHLGLGLSGLGRLGVVLFFFHTSYVLMGSLDHMVQGAGSVGRLFAAFWIRRIFRIYPLAILFVLVVAIFHIGTIGGEARLYATHAELVANLLLVQNLAGIRTILGPLWTLPLELQMYAILPALYLLLRERWRLAHAALMFAVSIGIALAAQQVSAHASSVEVLVFAPCFVAGVLAFTLRKNAEAKWRGLPAWFWVLMLVVATVFFGPRAEVWINPRMGHAWMVTLLLAIVFPFLREPAENDFTAATQWVAERSYGIYLSHLVLFAVGVHHLAWMPALPRLLVTLFSLLAVPDALYRWIETPLRRRGVRLSECVLRRPEEQLQTWMDKAPLDVEPTF
jgi:peptidoglycan/LPS O-acetylase OafA/YrhL